MSLIIKAISAFDTPSSLAPFFVKDAFDVTGRTVMANNEGGKHEAREKFIEEAGTSLFWIAGIPGITWLANKIAKLKTKINPDIHFKRINSNGIQGYFADEILENGKSKYTKTDLEGIELGKNATGKVAGQLAKIKANLQEHGFKPNESKGAYKKFHVGVSTGAVLFNLAMLMVALPKFNQYLSRKIIANEAKKNKESQTKQSDSVSFNSNQAKQNSSKKPSFGSLKDLADFKNLFNFTQMAENAQLAPTSSMLLLDYGISGSRVTVVPRDNNERVEYAVKEGGIILFFYYAADIIKSGLAKIADKVFKTPIDLDYKVMKSPEFLEKLKSNHNKEELLAFATEAKAEHFPHIKDEKQLKEMLDTHNELNIIKLIDKELAQATKDGVKEKEQVFKNFTLQMAQKEGLVDVEFDQEIGKWIRDSKKYIQTDKVKNLNNNLISFYESAFSKINTEKATTTIENILAKTKKLKVASVFGNMAICCASLSFFLPKLQYMIREHRTNTKSAPGIKLYEDMAKNNMI